MLRFLSIDLSGPLGRTDDPSLTLPDIFSVGGAAPKQTHLRPPPFFRTPNQAFFRSSAPAAGYPVTLTRVT